MRRQPYADLQQQYGNVAINISISTITGDSLSALGAFNLKHSVNGEGDVQLRFTEACYMYKPGHSVLSSSSRHLRCCCTCRMYHLPSAVHIPLYSTGRRPFRKAISLLSFMMNRRYTASHLPHSQRTQMG